MTGIILAGGKSKRMGENKAFIDAEGALLFERVYRVCKEIFSEIIIVANDASPFERYEAILQKDIILNKGALGGLYTGLFHSASYHAFCTACDMPLVNPRVIKYMVEERDEYDVVIPKTHDGLHPLHAIYSKECLDPMRQLLDVDDLRIINFFHQVRVRYIEEIEIKEFDPYMRSFINVNTEEEMEAVRNILRKAE
ncbi:MAG: molybdenum cofactor guanylyltransferase [Syntrophobacterales bacterium]|nr:MAG: molybdenum cofactor guanylyltransferase [Syntrophobacterales bacterium]